MSLPERLAHMSGPLTVEEVPLEHRLRTYLVEARELLSELSLRPLLERLLGSAGAAWTLAEMTGHLHVGFLTPAGTDPQLLARVARECGFTDSHAFFQSEIMARELAWRLQRPTVPTAIFKGDAPVKDGMISGVEAFTPSVESEIAAAWVRDGVGTHIALGLASPQSVERALELCRAAGFHPPPFFQGHPLLNVANAITVVYVDGFVDGESLRWEFYHTVGESLVCKNDAKCSDKAWADG